MLGKTKKSLESNTKEYIKIPLFIKQEIEKKGFYFYGGISQNDATNAIIDQSFKYFKEYDILLIIASIFFIYH